MVTLYENDRYDGGNNRLGSLMLSCTPSKHNEFESYGETYNRLGTPALHQKIACAAQA